jgi:ADP-ribose pyrophosphatase YjhB (NUDIX family)
MEPRWLVLARELQAMAQIGLAFTSDHYDRARYERLRAMAALIMADGFGADARLLEKAFAAEVSYATPKIDVRAAVFREGRILLVREIEDQGRWSLPGGWADVNQSASECVVREVREESGFEVAVRELAAVYDQARHPHPPQYPFHIYKMFFSAKSLAVRLDLVRRPAGLPFSLSTSCRSFRKSASWPARSTACSNTCARPGSRPSSTDTGCFIGGDQSSEILSRALRPFTLVT